MVGTKGGINNHFDITCILKTGQESFLQFGSILQLQVTGCFPGNIISTGFFTYLVRFPVIATLPGQESQTVYFFYYAHIINDKMRRAGRCALPLRVPEGSGNTVDRMDGAAIIGAFAVCLL